MEAVKSPEHIEPASWSFGSFGVDVSDSDCLRLAQTPLSARLIASAIEQSTLSNRERRAAVQPGKKTVKEKKPHVIARRNARERKRVQAVNQAFARLRRAIPYENKNKRLSKVKTLRIAIDYIRQLCTVLQGEAAAGAAFEQFAASYPASYGSTFAYCKSDGCIFSAYQSQPFSDKYSGLLAVAEKCPLGRLPLANDDLSDSSASSVSVGPEVRHLYH